MLASSVVILLAGLLAAPGVRSSDADTRADAAAAATPVAGAPAQQAPPAPVQPGPLPVTVALNRLAPGRPVPARFLGLSFEAAAISQLSPLAGHGNLVGLLRSLGPGLLRFGGVTADQNVAWTDAATPRPPWATSVIGPAQMRGIGQLARRSGWRVLLTVGMAHFEPLSAAREVAAAHAALGRNLAAVEIGNEPDSYGRHGFRELPWLAQGYMEQVGAYRQAIAALTHGVPIAGPDISGSGAFPEWGYAEAVSQTPLLLTGHHYPMSCSHGPSIPALLSPAIRGKEAQSLATYLSISRHNGIPLRIDETGSVSCGGVAGISNTLAAALWATAYITQGMAAGTVGVNLQGNPTNCPGYTPICAPDAAALAAGTLRAQPAWYAMLTTRSLVGYRPVATSIISPSSPNLVAAAFAGPHRSLKLVLVDDETPGSSPLAVSVPVGAGMAPAQVLRLSGPAQSSTEGVLLAGQRVAPDGSWKLPGRVEHAAVHAGTLAVRLAPSSAALVTVTTAKQSSHHRRRARGRHGH